MAQLPGAEPSKPPLPPGPRGGRLSTTVAFHRDPLGFLRGAQKRYGDVFSVRLATVAMVVVAEPDAIAQLAGADPREADAGAARRGVLPMASPHSVFGGTGEWHRRARERIEPAFSAEAVAERGGLIRSIAERHLAAWPVGRPLRLLPRMRALADEIFVRAVLGVEHEHRARELARAIGSLLWTPGNPPLSVPAPKQGLIGRAVDALYRHRRARVAALLGEEIGARRGSGPGGGALGLLLTAEPGAAEDWIVEELLSTLMAAQEPMAAALTWLSLCTAAEPGAAERIAQEGLEGEWGRALVSESLRLHPSALGVLRRLREDLALPGGHELPAGTTAMLPIPLLQRDPRRLEHPDSFRPERYLGRGALGGPDSPWLAFGGGARTCIGRELARAELGAVLPAMWRRLRLRPLGGPERMVLRATILVPQRSGLVRAAPVRARPRPALRRVPAAVDA